MFSCIFKKTIFSLLLSAVLTLAAGRVFAQQEQPTRVGGANSGVIGVASADRIRIAAPSAVVQLRLEVYDDSGQKLLDTEQRGGNVLDWHLQGGNGERVADGNYLCVVTVKTLSGRLSQKLGMATVKGQSSTLRPAIVAELTLQQAQAVGAVEGGEAALTVMPAENAQAVTVLANDGNEGQLARTRGALTFRVGDFLSGTDKEQMRLTEEGNLGIGISKPSAKLDVGGVIRAHKGFMFSDGSTLNVNDKGALTVTSPDGNLVPDAAGTGTLNRVAKWLQTGGTGTLGDSAISDVNGAVVIGNAGQTGNLQIFGTAGQDVFAGMGPDVNNGPAFNYGYAGTSFGRSAGFFNVRPDASAVAPNPSLRFMTANVQRMIVTNTGNVGIGTLAPQSLLDVAGDIRVAGNAIVSGNIAAKYQDIAEWVQTRQPIAAGMVVSLDSSLSNSVRPSARAYDTHVAGVVSAMPGVVLGQAGPGKALVSTTGRVIVMVDATRHPIRIGDLLVTSDLPGLAMKSQPLRVNGVSIHRPGTIIGKALEPLMKGRGKILVLLSLQ
jgi:hypothetical protein